MSDTALSTRITFTQVWVVVLMVAFSVMSYFDRTIMSIAGPEIMREFAISETRMGSIYSAFIISYALLMIPGGDVSDRFGPRRVLTIMGLGAALFTGLTAWCGRPGLGSYLGIVPAFFVIRLSLGAFTAPLYPACGRMNANWFPVDERATVWGLIAAGAGLGGAISPLLFPLTIARYGWRASFWLAAAATGILTFVWLVGVRDRPLEGDKNPGCGLTLARLTVQNQVRKTHLRRVLADRNLILLALGYSTVGYFEYIFFFWIYYYFGHVRHMQASQTAIYTTAIFLTWTVMTPLGGLISDSLSRRLGRAAGRRTVAATGMTAGALCLAAGVNLSHPLAIAMILSLALGLASCSEGPYWASAIDVGGNEVGAACGILNTGSNVGGAIAPLMTPFIAKGVGWSGALYFGCAVAMVGAIIWFFVDPTARAGRVQEPHPPAPPPHSR